VFLVGAAFVLALAAWGSGACSQAETVVSVRVRGNIDGVQQLQVMLTIAGQMRTLMIPDSPRPIALPTTFTVQMERSLQGKLQLIVVALDGGGTAIGRGSWSLNNVAVGQNNQVQIDLTPPNDPGPDGGSDAGPDGGEPGGDDAGTGPDAPNGSGGAGTGGAGTGGGGGMGTGAGGDAGGSGSGGEATGGASTGGAGGEAIGGSGAGGMAAGGGGAGGGASGGMGGAASGGRGGAASGGRGGSASGGRGGAASGGRGGTAGAGGADN